MKHRIISLLLSVALACSLCVPAFAADAAADQTLEKVTLAVKKTLAIGQDYSEFSGSPNDMGVMRYWSLYWSDDVGNSVSVTATDDGKIMQYSLQRVRSDTGSAGGFAPTLAKTSVSAARSTAEQFLDRVLTGNERGKLATDSDSWGANYYFSAQILLNGVPSPTAAQLHLDATDGTVIYYSRDDLYCAYVNDLPSATPKVTAAAAAASFAKAASLQLQYVPEGDGAAVLRYVPTVNGNLYVDAQTGALVDLSDVWADLNGKLDRNFGVTAAAEAAADETGGGLTAPEQTAVEALKGVLPKESLDAAVKKVTALGLSRYQLGGADYAVDSATSDVTCTLRYVRSLSYSELKDVSSADFKSGTYQQMKLLTVNAKTGALVSGYSYRPWFMKDGAMTRTAMQAAADSFLKQWQPSRAGLTALQDGDGEQFNYVRQVNGYPYPCNSIDLEIDPADGSVNGFQLTWDDDQKFEAAGTIISAAAAKTAFSAAWKTELQYVAYPVSVDVTIPIWKIYADCCGTSAYRYVLGYVYQPVGKSVQGIDAHTGKPVYATENEKGAAYTDISGSYAKTQISALADNGIRFSAAEQFQPAKKLTELDWLVLLLNADGYSYDVNELDDDELDTLYQCAWNNGFLSRGEKSPTKVLTRMGMLKMLLSASPYGMTAKLQNIFKTSFADYRSIPAADLGYAAIAEGLGLVRGNAKHQLCPTRTATRQEAAAILYNYMSR
jgi:hypothetical protein